MSPVVAIARAVLVDAARRKVVWMVIVFAGLLALVVPSLPSYGAGVVEAVFREVSIALMYAAALVVVVALAATRLPAEAERRIVYTLLTRDIRRSQYLLGTWLGIVAVTGVVLAAATLVTLVVGFLSYGAVMGRLLAATFAVWLEMGVLAAFGVMLSTRVGPVTSAFGTLTLVFVGHSVSTLAGGADANVQGASWYIPSLDVFDVINPVAHGVGYSLPYAAGMIVAFFAWSAALLAIAAAAFERRDL